MSTQSPLSQAVVALNDTLSDPVYTPGAPASTVSSAWLIKLIAAASRVVALSDAAEPKVAPVVEPVTEAPKMAAIMTSEVILAVAREALDSRSNVRAVIRYAADTGLPDQTLLTSISDIDGSNMPIEFTDFAEDGTTWQYIFADRQEEGILTLEIV